jgi:hypothetical protein
MPSSTDGTGIGRGDFIRGADSVGIAAGLAGQPTSASAQDASPLSPTSAEPKPATSFTMDVNALFRRGLPFNDTADFESASRGRIAALPNPVVIRNEEGRPVWDLGQYAFIGTEPTDNGQLPERFGKYMIRCSSREVRRARPARMSSPNRSAAAQSRASQKKRRTQTRSRTYFPEHGKSCARRIYRL